MMSLPVGTRVWLAVGRTDMRKGFDGLAASVQERMAQDPFCGHLSSFAADRAPQRPSCNPTPVCPAQS
jgi:transposase